MHVQYFQMNTLNILINISVACNFIANKNTGAFFNKQVISRVVY